MEIESDDTGDKLVFDVFEVNIIREVFRERARKFAAKKQADIKFGRFTLDLAFYDELTLTALLPSDEDYSNSPEEKANFNHTVIISELDRFSRYTDSALEDIWENTDKGHIFDEPEDLAEIRAQIGNAAQELHDEIVEKIANFQIAKSGDMMPDFLS